MSSAEFRVSIIKEETDSEPWDINTLPLSSHDIKNELEHVVTQGESPSGEEWELAQQGSALKAIKVRISESSEDEDDLLQLPELQTAFPDTVPGDETVFGKGIQTYKTLRKSSFNIVTSNSTTNIEELISELGTTKVLLKDCMQALLRSGRYCLQCRVLFNSTHDRRTHQQKSKQSKKTKQNRFECDKCQYSCDTIRYLVIHQRIHLSVKPYKCNLCEYRATQQQHLKAHQERKHFGYEKPFKCDMCDYKCKERYTLNKHIRTHTQEKQFKCTQCSYGSTDISNLYGHIRTVHAKVKAFKCDQCNHSASHKRDLKIHMMAHSNQRPYKCDQCKFSAIRSSNLKQHMRRAHAVEKLFQCDHCEFRSAYKSSLIKHIKKHKSE